MLVRRMYSLYQTGQHVDMLVIVNGDERVGLHSEVAAHHSTFFAASTATLLGRSSGTPGATTVVLTVVLNNVDGVAFRRIVEWMYTGVVHIRDADDALTLLQLACRLGIGDLETRCLDHFDIDELERHCLDYWTSASAVGSLRLMGRVSVFVARALRTMHDAERRGILRRLSAEAVVELLTSDAVCVYLAVELSLAWSEEHGDVDAGALLSRLRIGKLPLACIERLLQDRRFRTAHPVLLQCLDARRETIRRCRPASVFFVGIFPHDFDDDAPRSWTKVIRYDMATNRTTRVPDIPRHVGPTLCVAMDDSVFVFGGGPRDDDVFVYRENEWHVAGAMPSRAHFGAFDPREMSASVAGRYIVFVGATSLAFDTATSGWERLPPMAHPRVRCTSAAVGSRVFVFGGLTRRPLDESPESGVLSPYMHACPSDEVFDMKRRTWKPLKSTPVSRFDCTSVVVDKCIYVIGGSVSTGLYECTHVQTVASYQVLTDRIIGVGDMHSRRSIRTGRFFVSARNERTIYVFSERPHRERGYASFSLMEKFDIVSGTWTVVLDRANGELLSALATIEPLEEVIMAVMHGGLATPSGRSSMGGELRRIRRLP